MNINCEDFKIKPCKCGNLNPQLYYNEKFDIYQQKFITMCYVECGLCGRKTKYYPIDWTKAAVAWNQGKVVGTNFEQITHTVEKLAEWLDEHCEFCKEINCSECIEPICSRNMQSDTKRRYTNYELWLAWLEREKQQNED